MCGHPSTQKGPSTAHTAEIKVVHARLKRARELGIQAAPVVPVNYDVPRQLHEQRKRVDRRADQQEEQEPGRVEADRQPGLQAPPARGGQGDVLPLSREMSWSGDAAEVRRNTTRAERWPRVNLIRTTTKKATLMAALLNWTATQDYTQLYETKREEVDRTNSVLTALHKPSLTDQLSALKAILPFYKTPLQMEREVGTCSFFSAKKDPSKLVLSFSLLPQSPLTEITTLVCFALEAAGAERAPGAPPKGALFK